MALTPKQRAFVAHFLETLNATEAARRAGYSENSIRSIASENLTKPDILSELAKHIMTPEETALRITEKARNPDDENHYKALQDMVKILGMITKHMDLTSDGKQIAPIQYIKENRPND